jgi:hypothetical protein
MAADRDLTTALRGARIDGADLTGARLRDCELRQVKIVDSILVDVEISGDVEHVLVNDVDVTAFVTAELDRRHPERIQLRGMRTAADHRAMWDTLERIWADTLADARRLPESLRQERVDEEWSLVETLRHLVFATDAWIARTVLDQPAPYHPLGLTQPGSPEVEVAALGLRPHARPSFAEVLRARVERMALVRGVVDGLTDAELDRPCRRSPTPWYPERARTVGQCLGVVMREECEHHRYAVRDLAVLRARP